MNKERILPHLRDKNSNPFVAPYLTQNDGLQRSIPNICLKVPTGGGKTLLAAYTLERIQTDYLKQQTGLVLWVVPSDAIYRQTWKQLANREHPYRQILEGMIKLPINIINEDKGGWKETLSFAHKNWTIKKKKHSSFKQKAGALFDPLCWCGWTAPEKNNTILALFMRKMPVNISLKNWGSKRKKFA